MDEKEAQLLSMTEEDMSPDELAVIVILASQLVRNQKTSSGNSISLWIQRAPASLQKAR